MDLHQFEVALDTVRSWYGLDDWTMAVEIAKPEDRRRMEETGEIALCLPDGHTKHAIFTYHPQLFEQWLEKTTKTDPVLGVAVHEWGHIVLNPWPATGMFNVGGIREEIHANHLEYAFRAVREYLPEVSNDLNILIDKAYHVCHLDENNWRVRVNLGLVEFEGVSLPAFAYSLWGEDGMGWGIFAARQIDLNINPEYVKRLGLPLKDVVLREMWRVVLNPDGDPHRNNTSERALDHIMCMMKARGW